MDQRELFTRFQIQKNCDGRAGKAKGIILFNPLKRERSGGQCPKCSSSKIRKKYGSLERVFMEAFISSKLYLDLIKDRVCENCEYEWIEK